MSVFFSNSTRIHFLISIVLAAPLNQAFSTSHLDNCKGLLTLFLPLLLTLWIWLLHDQRVIVYILYVFLYVLEKEMATHSSILAWEIPWTEEPGDLQSTGSHRVRHYWSDLIAQLHVPEAWLQVVVQSLSCVQLFATPWTAARQASLSLITSRSLLKLTSTESVMPSNHLILCPLLLPLIFPSITVKWT